MIHLELFGQIHSFDIPDCSEQDVQSAIDLIKSLSEELKPQQQRERSYLTLLIKMALLYVAEKKEGESLAKHVDKVNDLCDMIEKSLGASQANLAHEV